ncbi:MAG: replication initiation protein [Clostridiales bacterium]|jgi:plasmid replication initiation protein|nr:replication initiation protein [Clostridiales bacterium]
MAIKKNYVVEKQNILNEIRANNMTLQELRFFSIYLSKINPRDVNTRKVRFTISDFKKIMELGKVNINHFKTTTDGLLCKIVRIPKKSGGYESFQLFKKCIVDIDENNGWYIEIDANDDALPLMFEFKEKYFSYQLWNALKLKSSNQLRMYEILKQYEKIGERVLDIEELRELLGISPGEYPRYDNFKMRVLDSCQDALEEYTDIKFTYEPSGKKGRGGKILFLKFNIYKNAEFKDPLSLEKFLEGHNEPGTAANAQDLSVENDSLVFYSSACDDEFSKKEMQFIITLIRKAVPFNYSIASGMEIEYYDYLRMKYDELNMRADKGAIKNRFGYLRKLIELDCD